MERRKTRGQGQEPLTGEGEDAKFHATDYGQRAQDQGMPKDLNLDTDDDATLIGARLPVPQEDEDPDIAR